MRIAVINEVSARSKNKDILAALKKSGHEVINVGMTDEENKTELTYIHTGFMAAALLNLGAVDMVIGGCGTGQGFLNSVMQYPNVFCGLILQPLDAFLFSQINAGNCISLALNKGYGWAGELNLEYIFEKLFANTPGTGFPPERSKSQSESRRILQGITQATHKPFEEILFSIDSAIIKTAVSHQPFLQLIMQYKSEGFERIMSEFK
jgi:ribose 5-phosphate isomerase RpiB